MSPNLPFTPPRVRRPRHPAQAPVFALGALVASLLAMGTPLAGQFVESPILPRGAILLELRSTHHQASRAFDGSGSTRGFGSTFDGPLTTQVFPALQTEEDRFRSLLDRPETGLSLGTLHGRLAADEQHTPMRIGWGATDRFTVGMTVPLVRRQLSTLIGIDPTLGNAGLNPAQGSTASEVNAFRNEAESSLATMQNAVETLCLEVGEDAPACVDGRAASERIESFLAGLDSAWDEALLFPLAGSEAGIRLRDRWAALRVDMSVWGAEAPDTLPLAVRPLDRATFESELGAPVWGAGNVPFDDVDPLVELGDIELHLAAALLTGREGPDDARIRVRSAVELTARFPTGIPDSLALLAPMDSPTGYGGVGARLVTDILVGEKLGLLSELDWLHLRDAELTLLGTDPETPWNPETARQLVSGSVGDRMRIRIAPRWILVPGLSLGAGWEWVRSGEALWTPMSVEGSAPGAGSAIVRPGTSRQLASVELRFAGWGEVWAESLPFPIELSAQFAQAFSGDAGAPRDRQLRIGVRVLRGAR